MFALKVINYLSLLLSILSQSTFPGLLPLIRHYVQETGGHLETIDLINSYLDLIQKRASG